MGLETIPATLVDAWLEGAWQSEGWNPVIHSELLVTQQRPLSRCRDEELRQHQSWLMGSSTWGQMLLADEWSSLASSQIIEVTLKWASYLNSSQNSYWKLVQYIDPFYLEAY